MNMKSIKLGALLLAMLLSPQTAHALDFQVGGQPKLVVEKVQMGVIVPPAAACPAEVTFKVWVFTNKAATVPILLDNGKFGTGPFEVETVKGSNGVYVGSIDHKITFSTPQAINYRAIAIYANKASNYVPAQVNCIY